MGQEREPGQKPRLDHTATKRMRGAANEGAAPGLLAPGSDWLPRSLGGAGVTTGGSPSGPSLPFSKTWLPSYPTDAHLIRNDPGGGLIGTVGGTSKELTV